MLLTRYGHSCLLVEGPARLLLDPVPSPAGSRSWRA
jgi:L-ascorbate metabolism protein UlaG (beta-lactamase superfamily)